MSSTLPDVARQMVAHDHGRDPERLAMKYARIRTSAFAFLRATAFLYYGSSPLSEVLERSPKAWLCGDLHLENFGTYRGSNGLVYFDINDFDEAALAPLAWDLGRLVTSMLVASHESTWPAATWGEAAKSCIGAYAQALASGKPLWIERRTARGPIRRLLRQLARRPQRQLLRARTTGIGANLRLIKDGKHALVATAADRRKVSALFREIGKTEHHAQFMRVLDVGRRIAGTSSLGMERYVTLVAGHGGRDGAALIDLKTEARPVCLAVGGIAGPWANDALRTVEIQRMAQALSPAGLSARRIGQRHYVMRELQPSEDRMDIDHLSDPAELISFAADLGAVTAWAHLRGAARHGSATVEELMAFGQRRDWRGALLTHAKAARRTLLQQHREFASVDTKLLLPKA